MVSQTLNLGLKAALEKKNKEEEYQVHHGSFEAYFMLS